MPEGYTHVRTARKAADALHYKIQCDAAFRAGANGPDILFCYEIWKPARKRHYDLPALGSRMHEDRTGAFLRSLCSHVRTRAQIEYALGFLSHYAADTVMHPFVCAMSAEGQPYGGRGGHGYLEIALDSTLHAEDTGDAAVPAAEVSPLPTGVQMGDVVTLLHRCLLETYGEDVPAEYLSDALYHLYRLRGLFVSRRGVRRALFRLAEPLFGGRGVITGHVSPACLRDLPDRWIDPFTGREHTGGVFALLPQAQARSETYMSAALQYWMGAITAQQFARVIGSMSYSQGRETERSRAPAAQETAAPPQDALQQPAAGPAASQTPDSGGATPALQSTSEAT